MGIFKKILERKEKGAAVPPAKKVAPKKKKVAPERVDPLALLGGESAVRSPSPPPSSPGSGQPGDSPEAIMRSKSEDITGPFQDIARSSLPSREEGIRPRERPSDGVPPEQFPEGALGPVHRKVLEAERGLSEMERTLSEAGFLFKGTEVFPRLKILLVEAKIKLAEAEIKLSETEIAPTGTSIDSREIENRISLAEGKIGEAEKILAAIPVQGPSKSNLSRLKIGVAGMKIRLAEIQIALAGSSLEGSSSPATVPSPIQTTTETSPPALDPALLSEAKPIRIERQDEPLQVRPAPPSEVKIHEEEPVNLSPSDAHNEPVRIKEESRESGPSEQSQKIILPDMEADPSPFETGINLNRVRIRNGESADSSDSLSSPQERLKIRSDERESAWVSEDGSLKIVSREPPVTGHSPDEEKPRISIHQPEVEKALVIEEMNRRGIDLRKKGELEGAMQLFERVLELDPRNEAALHNKGVAMRSAGRFTEALACFDRAQERDPDNLVIWFNRGFCLGKLERYEEALKAFDRVLALDPNHASGWFNKGKILQKMGRMEEAEEHLQKARELGYQ